MCVENQESLCCCVDLEDDNYLLAYFESPKEKVPEISSFKQGPVRLDKFLIGWRSKSGKDMVFGVNPNFAPKNISELAIGLLGLEKEYRKNFKYASLCIMIGRAVIAINKFIKENECTSETEGNNKKRKTQS